MSAVTSVQVIRRDWTQYVPDYFAYGLLPVAAYLTLLVAGVMIYAGMNYAPEVRRVACAYDREYPQRMGPHVVHGAAPCRRTAIEIARPRRVRLALPPPRLPSNPRMSALPTCVPT